MEGRHESKPARRSAWWRRHLAVALGLNVAELSGSGARYVLEDAEKWRLAGALIRERERKGMERTTPHDR